MWRSSIAGRSLRSWKALSKKEQGWSGRSETSLVVFANRALGALCLRSDFAVARSKSWRKIRWWSAAPMDGSSRMCVPPNQMVQPGASLFLEDTICAINSVSRRSNWRSPR